MATIYVGFSRAKSPLAIGSKLIQETEKRSFSHAFIKFKDPTTGVIMVSQASHGFVNMEDYSIFKERNIVVEEFLIPCTNEQFVEILRRIHQNSGKPYSKLQLLLIAIKKLLHFEIKIRNNDEAFICSEWAAFVCKVVNKAIPEELDYETPSDLQRLLIELGFQRG